MSLSREELEEAAGAARDVARVTKAQYDAFRESGFGKTEAMTLTLQWLTLMFGQTADAEGGED